MQCVLIAYEVRPAVRKIVKISTFMCVRGVADDEYCSPMSILLMQTTLTRPKHLRHGNVFGQSLASLPCR